MTILLQLWGFRTLRSLLAAVSLWQVKEYRLERLRAHLALPSARKQLLHPISAVKWGGVLWLLTDLSITSSIPVQAGITVMYTLETILFARELLTMRFRRPRLTGRALLICGLTVASIGILWTSLAGVHVAGRLLILDRAAPLLVAVAVLLSEPLAGLHRLTTLRKARQHVGRHPRLTTVGITGSFGKSSTKEFLTAILRGHFSVLQTPLNVNTDIGIARTVLQSLREHHDVFVCEMGAYRQGEIARAAKIVSPRIGILTAVSNQHLALFGSKEKIAAAKGELLEALPAEGTAIVNGDDPTCVRLANGIRARRVLRYGSSATADVRALKTEVLPQSLRVTVEVEDSRADFVVPLLGEQQLPSILAATAAALLLGMKLEEIAQAAESLAPLPRTMEYVRGQDDTMIIDDTYSANPEGVIAAIKFLRHTGRKTNVVVLTSMIELGRTAREAHQNVGEALAYARPERTVLTSSDYADAIIRGARAVHAPTAERISVEPDSERALAIVRPLLGSETAILLEGRIPEILRQTIRPRRQSQKR